MSDYFISPIRPTDARGNRQVDELLQAEGIRRDGHLDYTCGLFDEDYHLSATGSCFGSTLRCLAVSRAHQGEGLMNQVVSHLVEVQCQRGNLHLFLYTKCATAPMFTDLGFYEIARVAEQNVVFLENRRTGFADYCRALAAKSPAPAPRTAAIVMNANPFTLGHQYLVERAAAENDLVHLFLVSEDASLFPTAVRRELVRRGTAHLPNVTLHDSGPYLISSATFPSYFQKDELSVIEGHARLDLAVFCRMAETLGITCRYVGEEPRSQVTGAYNRIMKEELPRRGIACVELPRRESGGALISASTVRESIRTGALDQLAAMVPESTLAYLQSPEAEPVLRQIRSRDNVIHY